MAFLQEFEQGNIRALAKIISFVENRHEGYRNLLSQLYPRSREAIRIGITGPPGAGKSTLVNRLLYYFVNSGKKVAVIAVDPTSPFTGGALLGDRVRMQELPDGKDVYFRSMATRGAAGGLAGSTDNVAVLLAAFGFEIIIIETVGVGQIELDIIDTCDSVVVTVVPESGDAVQAMKAGLMEIADIIAVNKADRAGAENLVAELQLALHLQNRPSESWEVPVQAVEALNNKNIDLLFDHLNEHLKHSRETGRFESHRQKQIEKKIINILKSRLQRELWSSFSEMDAFRKAVDDIQQGASNPWQVGDLLYQQVTADR